MMIRYIDYREKDHGAFNEEWYAHKKVSGWWYATGYLTDYEDDLFAYQFTLVKPFVYSMEPFILMLALTDIKNDRHYYYQKVTLFKRNIEISDGRISFGNLVDLEKGNHSFKLKIKTDSFNINIKLIKLKEAVWHADHGVLKMGYEAKNNTTVYYSYTNLPTIGSIKLNNRQLNVKGKTWFNRQWGPYDLIDPSTHWEWFSLRFFDDEEVILFAFPQNNYYDGTFINKDGKTILTRDYKLTPTSFTTADGLRFSNSWDLFTPNVKQERYSIKPLARGQFNIAYFELLAGIYNKEDKLVGYSFVELLPGVLNKENYSKNKMALNLFKKRAKQL